MASYRYERLSAQDNSFLMGETPTAHMHVTGVLVFRAEGLRAAEGGVDFAALRRAVEGALHRVPRYHQKLQWAPLTGAPVWVDDPDFNLAYHLRHTALPRPGSAAQLKRLAGRIMAQPLDRGRPLWEMWVVEGLEGGKCFALISKVHHCMIDGVSGADLVQLLLSLQPVETPPEAQPYIPRPAPSPGELLRDEVLHRLEMPFALARSARNLRAEGESLRAELAARAGAIGDLIAQALDPPSETPLNGPLGPHRRFDWLSMPLADVKALRRAAQCTVNDVVLAVATGAFRAYLKLRNVEPSQLKFVASAPVSMRREEEQAQLGNRVSAWMLRLPLEEEKPLARLKAVHAQTREMKTSRSALGVETMMKIAEWTPPVLLSLGAQAAGSQTNTIITNVPGPQFPLYLLGAKLLNMYPMAPLLENMGLAIALFSYDGKLNWGFIADYNRVPDVPMFRDLVEKAFAELASDLNVEITGALPPEF